MKVIYIFNNYDNVVLNDFVALGLMTFLDFYCQDAVIKYLKVPEYAEAKNIDDDYDFLIINVRSKQPDGEIAGFVFDTKCTTIQDVINFIHLNNL